MQCTDESYRRPDSSETVYVVEPDVAIRDGLETLLNSFGIPTEAYADSASFLRVVGCLQQGYLLVEAEQSGVSGFELLKTTREQGSDIPELIIVDQRQRDFAIRAWLSGASSVLEKPFINDDVIGELQRLGGDRWPQLAMAKTQVCTLATGEVITLRPMQPSDRGIEQAFVRDLSATSRVRRFLGGLKELSDSMLDKFTHIHYPDNIALIATVSSVNKEEQIGVARYAMTDDETAEFAIAVADAWQGQGVGRLLLRRLLECAQSTEIRHIIGSAFRENRGVQRLAREISFNVSVDPADASLVILRKPMDWAARANK